MRVYLNTSILIKAVNPREPGHREALRFLEECCSKHECVVSNVHRREYWYPKTRRRVNALLRRLKARRLDVDLDAVSRHAEAVRERLGLSMSRTVDLMHLVAAKTLGCSVVAAVDRFMRRYAHRFGLRYVNHYTGCP